MEAEVEREFLSQLGSLSISLNVPEEFAAVLHGDTTTQFPRTFA